MVWETVAMETSASLATAWISMPPTERGPASHSANRGGHRQTGMRLQCTAGVLEVDIK